MLAAAENYIEFIVELDDGSTDKTYAAVHGYAEQYSNNNVSIKVVKNKIVSGGESSDRNFEIEMAKYEYVTLCDADDTVEVETYTEIIRIVEEKDHPDLMCWNYQTCLLKEKQFPSIVLKMSVKRC